MNALSCSPPGSMPAVCWNKRWAHTWSSCQRLAPLVDDAFRRLSLLSQATCWLLWAVQLPGGVSAGPGLPAPSFWVTSFRNRPRRVLGLSTTKHFCRTLLGAECFAILFIGFPSEHQFTVKIHYSSLHVKEGGVVKYVPPRRPHHHRYPVNSSHTSDIL